ncbi:hypothetical protein J6590_060861 [Homalodisca vitripennis]|nr:hypothetical protein J6590_060861 [Homalodisca vitripennis]
MNVTPLGVKCKATAAVSALANNRVYVLYDTIRYRNVVCEEVKPKYDTYKSFKIGVCEEVFETVLDPEFWDEGVLVKKYIPPRRYNRPDNFLGQRRG